MATREYEIDGDEDDVPLASFLDEFDINPEMLDIRKLRVKAEIDWGNCWYPGDRPTLRVTVSYDELQTPHTPNTADRITNAKNS